MDVDVVHRDAGEGFDAGLEPAGQARAALSENALHPLPLRRYAGAVPDALELGLLPQNAGTVPYRLGLRAPHRRFGSIVGEGLARPARAGLMRAASGWSSGFRGRCWGQSFRHAVNRWLELDLRR